MKITANPNKHLFRAALCFAFISLLLSACALPKIQLPFISASVAQGEEVVAAEAASLDAPSSTEETRPTATAPLEPTTLVGNELTAQDGLSGLILFTSLANDPFATSDAGKVNLQTPVRHLWGITPDGKRAGRMSPEGYSSALVPAGKPEGKTLLIANGVEGVSEAVISVAPPEACQDGGSAACGGFNFGLQGRTFAYFSGEESCGRTLTLVERATGAALNTWNNVAWYRFNQDGGLLLSLDDCSRRYIYQYIPNTAVQSGMASDGVISWDPSRKAALVQVHGEAPVLSALWGFNLDTSSAILWHEQGKTMQDSPVWLDDGRHFVYQHRAIRYDKESQNAYLDGPRQIILMDAWTRAQHLLAFRGDFDFHLCPNEGEPCAQPYGDWLKVTRTPFQPGGLKLGDPSQAVITRCALFGMDCVKPAEEFALNWKTGEMLPWADANLPAPQPAPAFPPPDQSTESIYSDPGGAFALYTSADGHALWYVPSAGDPVLWVTDGENFVYVP